MREFVTLAEIDQAVQAVQERLTVKPVVGLVLGSGLGGLADRVSQAVSIPYDAIPAWPTSTVQGHAGRLVAGDLFGVPVLVQQGRAHFYEGYSMAEVTLPVRVMKRLGIDILILTNAAGAIHPDFDPGDIMLITDHIALVGMTGFNPLRGPNLDEFGPRFPDMSQVYDRGLAEICRSAAQKAGIVLREGVYCGLSGPSFEFARRFALPAGHWCRRGWHVYGARSDCRPACRDAHPGDFRDQQQGKPGWQHFDHACRGVGSRQEYCPKVGNCH